MRRVILVTLTLTSVPWVIMSSRCSQNETILREVVLSCPVRSHIGRALALYLKGKTFLGTLNP